MRPPGGREVRLQENDFRKHATQQLALLHAAARLIAPAGAWVYAPEHRLGRRTRT